MKKVTKDIDSILSLEEKRLLLKELGQEDLLDVFKKDYKPKYTPPVRKRSPLDQQVSFSVSETEKQILSNELFEIKKVGPGVSISAYVRNQIIADIDIKSWGDKALRELNKLSSPEFNKKTINERKRKLMQLLEDAEDDEDLITYERELAKINKAESKLKKKTFKRKYRLAGRITFSEAQIIRWRAARLNLTIADYLRYLTFGYEPGSEADLNLSLDDRRRFYISILDVKRNGWGEPPNLNQCPNCLRYMKEVKELKAQLQRYRTYLDEVK